MIDPFVVGCLGGLVLAVAFLFTFAKRVKPATGITIAVAILSTCAITGFNLSFSDFKQRTSQCDEAGGHKHPHYNELCISQDGRIIEP